MSSLRNSYRQVARPPEGPILRAMTIDGTTNGLSEQNDDYSVTPTKFWIQPPDNNDWRVATFSIVVSATGSRARTNYGSINGGLTNGIDFFSEIDGVESIVTAGEPLRNNSDLLRNGRTFALFDFNAGDDSIFAEDNILTFCDGLLLRGSFNEKFGIIINDDLSNLTQHQVFVKAADLGPRIV